MRIYRLGAIAGLLVLIVLVLNVQQAHWTPRFPENPRLQALIERQTIIVGTAITEPFEFYDAQGQLVGYDVDLMHAIAERLGVQVVWRHLAFADLLPQLQAGQLDAVIAAMYVTPQRLEEIAMSRPYIQTGLVSVVADNNTDPLTPFPQALIHQRIGVKEGSTGERFANRLRYYQGISIRLQIYTDTLDSLNDLQTGHVDVVFNDQLNTLFYIQQKGGVRIVGDIIEPAGLGIAVQQKDTELLTFINDSLNEFEQNGFLKTLYTRWIAQDVDS